MNWFSTTTVVTAITIHVVINLQDRSRFPVRRYEVNIKHVRVHGGCADGKDGGEKKPIHARFYIARVLG